MAEKQKQKKWDDDFKNKCCASEHKPMKLGWLLKPLPLLSAATLLVALAVATSVWGWPGLAYVCSPTFVVDVLLQWGSSALGRATNHSQPHFVKSKTRPEPRHEAWHRAPVPKHIVLNRPQFFDVHLRLNKDALESNFSNSTLNLKLMLTHVVPQFRAGRAIQIFGYKWRTLRLEIQGKIPPGQGLCQRVPGIKTECYDFAPYVEGDSFGSLKCEWISNDNVTVGITPIRTVFSRAQSVLVSIITTCQMPSNSNASKLRVLRGHDTGPKLGTNMDDLDWLLEPWTGVQCPNNVLKPSKVPCSTIEECADVCRHSNCGYFVVDDSGCMTAVDAFAQSCVRASDGHQAHNEGRVTRQRPWELHPLELEQVGRRLLTIGATEPLFGSDYISRVPEWLAYHSLVFPDAYFIMYFTEDTRAQVEASPIASFIKNHNATAIWLRAPLPAVYGGLQNPHSRDGITDVEHLRCANDFMYRTQTFSMWSFPTIDYDEYVAPTAPPSAPSWANYVVAELKSSEGWQLSFDPSDAARLFSVQKSLAQAPRHVVEICLSKWTTEFPTREVSAHFSIVHGIFGIQ